MPPTITTSRNTTRMASQSGSTVTAASVTYIDHQQRLVGDRIEQRADGVAAAVAPRQPAVHRVGQAGGEEQEERRGEPVLHHQPDRQRHGAQPART